jgi:superfamily I DNA/RNA helicase
MIDALAAPDPRAPLVLISGDTASGKTAALTQRYAALVGAGRIAPAATVVAATTAAGARALAERIAPQLPDEVRAAFGRAPFVGITLDVLAFAIVGDGALEAGLAPDLERLEPYESEEVFERAAAPLFSAEWGDYVGADVDPEISGLRAPDRFASAVLRLIVKLRDAGIDPDELLKRAQRGATTFYARPPNFAEPGLLAATRDEHRGSLMVTPAELERQRRREIDLAKIVAKLYRSYLDRLVEHGCLATVDALAEAVRVLSEQPPLAASYRERLRLAVVDDVHDLRTGELRLLQVLFGEQLAGVTFAGSLQAATQTFAGARPEATFKLAATTIATTGAPPNPAIAAAARALLGETAAAPSASDAVRVHRFADRSAEIAFVADAIAERVRGGIAPARIALLHRTARTLVPFEEALLERNVPIALHGDVDLLSRADVGDALALLWSAVDPFRHDWLLRALQTPLAALSDASLALLCSEPADPQALLFPLPAEDPGNDRRWDRRRNLRLATNVVRGERDADLDDDARARVSAFRARRARWAAHARDVGTRAARDIIADAALAPARAGESAARTVHRGALLEALLRLIDRYGDRYRGAPLEDALAMLERVASGERGPSVDDRDGGGAYVGAIEQVGPLRFDDVFVVDVRSGSFPPYYVPDAFLFSPQYGMIPKDAVGDGTAARTAKFTWYSHVAKLRDSYAREQRRLLALAIGRADRSVTVTASGKPTRGIAAPELAVELAALVCG